MAVQTKIQLRRDSATNWSNQNPVLAAGEIGYDTTNNKFKIGTGSNTWSQLFYQTDASLLAGAASLTSLTTTGNVVVGGNLTVNGTTTSLNSSTLQIDDKNIELGSVANISGVLVSTSNGSNVVSTSSTAGFIVGQAFTANTGPISTGTITSITNATHFIVSSFQPSTCSTATVDIGGSTNVTADGAGITVLATTGGNKTLQWTNATAAWTSSEDFNLVDGKVYEINAVTVLSSTQVLGYSIASTNTANNIVVRDASGNFAANTITASLTGTASLASNLTGGIINTGRIVFQSGVNTTSQLAATTTNNQYLAYNTSSNAPFWVTPTLSNTYYGTTTTADQLRGVFAASNTTGTGNLVFANNATLVTPVLGTPSSGNLVSTTGYTVDNLANTTANVITFLKTPSSANFLNAVTGATGNAGGVVFANNATLVAPTLGVANATSINKVTFTAPATSATLTLANGSTLQTIGAFFINATATANTDITFPTGGTLANTTFVGSATVAQANNITANAAQVNRIAYASAANTTAFLPFPAANNYILTANTSGEPFWAAPASTGVTGLVAGNGITVSGSTGTVTVNTNAAFATTWTATQTFSRRSNLHVGIDSVPLSVRANLTQTVNLVEVASGDGTTNFLTLSNTGTLFAVTIDGGTA